ncbi:hypothetical protein GW17_00012783 [Ensete ventricosum]|nr:hypothetical protein GW17_00012783 [Ensete ventricosum]
MKGVSLLAVLCLLLLSPQHHVEAAGGFIRTRGLNFVLDGNPFFANGFNAYWLMTLASDPSQRGKVSAAFTEASSHGLLVARTWAFSDGGGNALQYSPGHYNERTFTGQYIASDDDFFTNPVVGGFYKNHVKLKTITLALVLVQRWIAEMAAYVKSIDSNHLLEAGLEGFYGASSPQKQFNPRSLQVGTDFIANNRIPNIDFATVHVYPDQWLSTSNDQSQLAFLSNWIDAHIRDARDALRKPLLVTEFGKSSKDPGFSVGQRDALFKTVYSKIYWSARSGGSAAGGFFWQLLSQGMGSYGDGYEVVLSEGSSTARIIALQSRQLRYLGKWYARQRNVAKLNKAKAMREEQEERQRVASKADDAGN